MTFFLPAAVREQLILFLHLSISPPSLMNLTEEGHCKISLYNLEYFRQTIQYNYSNPVEILCKDQIHNIHILLPLLLQILADWRPPFGAVLQSRRRWSHGILQYFDRLHFLTHPRLRKKMTILLKKFVKLHKIILNYLLENVVRFHEIFNILEKISWNDSDIRLRRILVHWFE